MVVCVAILSVAAILLVGNCYIYIYVCVNINSLQWCVDDYLHCSFFLCFFTHLYLVIHPTSLVPQVTSASFIDQLSEEYPEYIDIIQPVQVAIYEIKLGLSVAVSSALQKAYLHEVGGSADQILVSI